MTDYRAILRLDSLKLQHKQIAESLGVSRTTVIRVLRRAQEVGLYWSKAQDMGDRAVSEALFPTTDGKLHYKLPDYEAVHTAMAQPGVTLQLLWIEYCCIYRSASAVEPETVVHADRSRCAKIPATLGMGAAQIAH